MAISIPTDAPIADAEDLLGIGSQDQIDIAGTGAEVSECFLDRIGMIDREIHAAGTPALMVILFHRQADGPVVDNRNHLAQMLGEQAEEQHFVAVVQRGQVDILAQGVRQPLVLGIGAGDLSFQRADDGREQTSEAQGFPFLHGEGRPLVEKRRGEHRHSSRLGFMGTHSFRASLSHRRG